MSLDASLLHPPLRREETDRDRAVLITHMVAYATGVPALEIVAGAPSAGPAADARHLAMYLAHTALSWTLARVGAAFGRDRTTVGHACRRVEDRRDDPGFDACVAALEASLRAAPGERERLA